jgi:hypothetical protein
MTKITAWKKYCVADYSFGCEKGQKLQPAKNIVLLITAENKKWLR